MEEELDFLHHEILRNKALALMPAERVIQDDYKHNVKLIQNILDFIMEHLIEDVVP